MNDPPGRGQTRLAPAFQTPLRLLNLPRVPHQVRSELKKGQSPRVGLWPLKKTGGSGSLPLFAGPLVHVVHQGISLNVDVNLIDLDQFLAGG